MSNSNLEINGVAPLEGLGEPSGLSKLRIRINGETTLLDLAELFPRYSDDESEVYRASHERAAAIKTLRKLKLIK